MTYNCHCDSEYQQVQDGEKVIYGRQSFCYTESIGAGAGQAEEGACQLGCCTVNGPRTLGMLADWGLLLLPVAPGADTPAGAVLNFFGPCVMKAQLGATALTLAQTTSYPFSPGVQIRVGVSAAATSNFALWVRIPAWSEETELSVNGASVAAPAGDYAKIDREWRDGDEIEVRFDFRIRCWTNRTDLVGLTTMASDAQPPAPQTASPQPAWSCRWEVARVRAAVRQRGRRSSCRLRPGDWRGCDDDVRLDCARSSHERNTRRIRGCGESVLDPPPRRGSPPSVSQWS